MSSICHCQISAVDHQQLLPLPAAVGVSDFPRATGELRKERVPGGRGKGGHNRADLSASCWWREGK